MTSAKLRSFLPALAVAFLFPASAAAFEYVSIGAGFLGQAGGNFLDKPDNQDMIGPDGQVVDVEGIPDYPGFAGMTAGFGFFVDFRVLDYVGIELDVLRQWDKGQADLKIEINDQENEFEVEIRQGAWHLPLLLKGVIPGEVVQPFLFIGPEFVVVDNNGEPEGAEAEIISGSLPRDAAGNFTPAYAAFSENYIALMFGLGIEFKLPIPEVDIRIPFSLRGSVNLDVPEDRTQTADTEGRERQIYATDGSGNLTVTKVEYKTNFKYQAVGNLGLGIHF